MILLPFPAQDCGPAAAQRHHRSVSCAVVHDPRTEGEADSQERPNLSEVSTTTSD